MVINSSFPRTCSIYTLKRDDIPLLLQWIKKDSPQTVFFGAGNVTRTRDLWLYLRVTIYLLKSIVKCYSIDCSKKVVFIQNIVNIQTLVS